jgi:hypothetical protein
MMKRSSKVAPMGSLFSVEQLLDALLHKLTRPPTLKNK